MGAIVPARNATRRRRRHVITCSACGKDFAAAQINRLFCDDPLCRSRRCRDARAAVEVQTTGEEQDETCD